VTATELANDSKAILDKVIKRGEKADVERRGCCFLALDGHVVE
jgi:hypothetical protein